MLPKRTHDEAVWLSRRENLIFDLFEAKYPDFGMGPRRGGSVARGGCESEMSRFNLLIMMAGVVAVLIGVAVIANFMGVFGDTRG